MCQSTLPTHRLPLLSLLKVIFLQYCLFLASVYVISRYFLKIALFTTSHFSSMTVGKLIHFKCKLLSSLPQPPWVPVGLSHPKVCCRSLSWFVFRQVECSVRIRLPYKVTLKCVIKEVVGPVSPQTRHSTLGAVEWSGGRLISDRGGMNWL